MDRANAEMSGGGEEQSFADRNKQTKLEFSRETITTAVHPVQPRESGRLN